MNRCLPILALLLAVLLPWGVTAEPSSQHTVNLSLRVASADTAARQLVQVAQALGGWFTVWDADQVEFRIPVDRLNAFIDSVASRGRILTRGVRRQDRSAEFASIQSRLRARKGLLDAWSPLLDSAAPGQVQVVQREVVELIAQIEFLEGNLRNLRADCALAGVVVRFGLEQRVTPARVGTSPFRWVAALHPDRLREAFQ